MTNRGTQAVTRVAVIDDWQGVARASADWSALQERAQVVFFETAFAHEDDFVAAMDGFDVIMTMRERTAFPASLIARLPGLKMLNVTGMRNRSVDIAALSERGVTVSGTETGEAGHATAELSLALMLAAARAIPHGDRNLRSGLFQAGIAPGLVLHGRTLGLLGLGRLGSLMARYGAALGMDLIAWSPNITAVRAKAAGAEAVTKEDLFRRSDVVSIHMVLSPSTTGLVGESELSLMKKGAILVNTSRGPLVDEAALVSALAADHLVAALDVYDREPLPADHPLRSSPNTILSPHLGYCVEENYRAFHRQGIENVLAYLDGRPIRQLTPN